MNDLKAQLETFTKKFESIIAFVSNHTVFVFFLIASLAVLGALLQSRSYLTPSRDETKYNEGISAIQYKTIDKDALDSLNSTDDDTEIEVNPSLVPDRNNPFAE